MSGSVSVVIPNIDGEELLERCLGSLRVHGSYTMEVIVVDNGSQDGSVQKAKRLWPGVKVIENQENKGYAEACAQGIEISHGDYVLLLNNDVQLSTGALDGLVAVLDNFETIGACQPISRMRDGRLDSAGSLFRKTGFLHHVESCSMDGAKIQKRFALKGACLLVRRSAYAASGGLDKNFFAYFEETDLCWRMLLAGWQLVVVPDVLVLHEVGWTTRRLFDNASVDYLSFRNRITSIRRNSGWALRYRVLVPHLALCIGTAVAFLISGRYRSAIAITSALVWQVRHSREVTAGRRHYRSYRTESDRVICDLTIKTDWTAAFRLLYSYVGDRDGRHLGETGANE